MKEFKPFENDTQSLTVGPGDGITIENGKENIVIYGDLEISKETDPEEIEQIITALNAIKKKIKP